ncbi:hypothetical protein KSP40_PGU002895 [Platanthera guangdongensis]|uniref:APO domain-containing protein n=1 Tax=Platanthera guangdongensis TaxID=2320717 RepID=A0ABR2LGQ4_9ASPA
MVVIAVVVSRFPSGRSRSPSTPSSAFNCFPKPPAPFLQYPRGSIVGSSSSNIIGEKLFLAGDVHQSRRSSSSRMKLPLVSTKSSSDSHDSQTCLDAPTNKVFGSAPQEPRHISEVIRYNRHPQNVDLPPVLPKNKKKPYLIPIHKMQRAARREKKMALMGIEKHLDPPKNGLLVPELIPVAYQTLESWKVLIESLAQLLTVVPVYGCR